MISSDKEFIKSAGALSNPIQYLKGVGPKRAALFAQLGIATVSDLLHYYPRDWQDRHETKDLSLPTATGIAVIKAKVMKAGHFQAGPRLALFKAKLATGTETVEAVWFKHLSRRYDVFSALKAEVVPGADLWVVGRGQPSLLGIRELHVDEHYLLSDPRWRLHVGRIVPVYALTEGISQRFLRELVYRALNESADGEPDILPKTVSARRELLAPAQALKGIHFPGSQPELEAARARLAFEELLLLELAWILKRRQTRSLAKGFQYEIQRSLLTPFREHLGFELTGAQKRVIKEIFSDMQRPYPMTRLLQGDVGSGKTVVALSALLLAAENGAQGAFMAPTEILADQHMGTISRFVKGLPVRTAMLTSRVKPKERESILAATRKGELDLLVGTHALLDALLETDVQFPKLRLAVIDEQHRFGVRQRSTLRQKSSLLDLLVMTATPIPRTLALALYGDLDVSTLDEMPPGKVTASTAFATEAAAFSAVRDAVAKGRQAYVVYPIIEESSRLDLQSAKAEFKRLAETVFRDLRVSLIHGGMPGRQKSKVMAEFAAGKSDVLVATPVIEVGIDVPNATVMVIQNADRFGLASLHQLRGRIGRGTEASSCFLVADPKTPQAHARIETLVKSSDGFRIGEEDLKLRGAGELLGTAQHGELTLKVADVVKDAPLLALARQDAETLLDADPRLLSAENAALRARVISLYQKKWTWIDLA
jgi:ATP-dependent DNA helicase RecG